MRDGRKKILVVEDYDDSRRLVEKILLDLGYEVTACATGADAIHCFLDSYRSDRHAGVLMDLSLEDINGLAVIRVIRTIERASLGCEPTRIAIFSGEGSVIHGTDLFKELDVSLFLEKPIIFESLEGQLERWLANRTPFMLDAMHLHAAR